MAGIDKKKIFIKDKLIVKDRKTDEIHKIVFPHSVEFGIPNYPSFLEDVIFYNGLTGSLTKLVDGTSYLIAGTGVSINTGSKGEITISSTGGGSGGTPGGSNTQVQFNEGGVFAGSSGFAFDKTKNNLFVSGFVTASLGFTGSLTRLLDGTSYLIAGNDITISTGTNGSITISSNQSIGSAEDGSYTDGLFADFSTSTPVGTAVDRFNEILKALAPGPAPDLDDVDFNNSSIAGKLSFGAANTIAGYTNSNTTAGFSAVNVDGTYQSATSGNNLRIGLLDGSTDVIGDLNEDISADTHSSGQTNFVANSFGNANLGTLKLFVNDTTTPIHTVDLTDVNVGVGVPGSGTDNEVNGDGSGFINLSATGDAKFSDGTSLDLFKHRTGQFKVAAASQRNGWNYAKIVHSLSSGDISTNFIEWINDSDSNALSGSDDAFDTLNMTGDLRLSGVKYFTGGTAEYRVRVVNAYKNVYSADNITFTESGCTISNQSFPASGNDENKILHLTGSATINASTLLNESISARAVVPHPLKSDLTTTNQSISNILMYNLSNNSKS